MSNDYRTGTGPIGDQTPGGRPGTGSNPLGPRGSAPLGVDFSVHWKGGRVHMRERGEELSHQTGSHARVRASTWSSEDRV